ncbi:type IX secretion system membrane protein PorP/SprF [Rapidithrix thailandica]|uniref:Type IX secretion system membrane protein PorP/SprF n=1 Tax=Rapidithrix thailandica TaxID=413964 RepID=A0AAW9S1U5_9BACT
MKRYLLIVLLFISYSLVNAQHLPLLGNYMFNGLTINPAYAGSRKALSIAATHRTQWAGFEGAPTTQVLSAHGRLERQKLGLGLMFLKDKIGLTNQYGAYGTLAYYVDFKDKSRKRVNKSYRRYRLFHRLKESKLSFGLQFGYSHVRTNWSQAILEEENDPLFTDIPNYEFVPNVGVGMYYYNDVFFAGLSAPNLLNTNGSPFGDERTFGNFLFSTGFLLNLNEYIQWQPSTLLRYIENSPVQFDINSNFIFYEKLLAGLSYRHQDALIPIVQLYVSDQFRVGYTYEVGISDLKKYHHGSHEILLMYEFRFKSKVMHPKYF